MTVSKISIAAGAAAVLAAAAVAAWMLVPASKPPVKDVKFQLPWTHSASYAGFYSADNNGDFAGEGLQVEFLIGGPHVDPIGLVVSGEAQMGLANGADLLRARGSGQPVKAVACIYRLSPLVYITLKSSGIDHPGKFAGKTVRASRQNTIVLKAMISDYDIDFDSMTVVFTNDIDRMLNGEIDIWSGYSAVSLERLVDHGLDLNIMHPDNFGAHFYYSCVFSTDQFINDEPEVILGFLRASLQKGWPRAFRNPEAAAALVNNYGPEVNIGDQAKAISIMLPLVDTGTGDIGWTDADVWGAMASELKRQGLLETPVTGREIYDGQFIEAVFGAEGVAP
ncbi:ABC transporter substrate-binding protein [Antarctobacter sp.]|uniref:ABC transporter substrate-binding protein n=1 Tax=Antarctobacter sp. TaxID=1872577 RepID=UPI002B26BEC4|nr:ABC transporter substrate-binding protein [Antarctobacter sp.]